MGESDPTVPTDDLLLDRANTDEFWEEDREAFDEDVEEIEARDPKAALSFWGMILLTICLTGVQITWTVELAYGNPYLRDLNLSASLSALVWLAGPLSGLLIQPIVGVYSDKCGVPWGRRRPFMIAGGGIVLFSIALIAYAAEIAQALSGSMDSKTNETMTILSAVVGFYFLDFSINAVQASCRSLIVDMAPIHQQEMANAWGGRMIGVGNVAGYFLGFLDLPRLFPIFGSHQMKVFCWLASIWFSFTLFLTCYFVKEKQYIPKASEKRRSWYGPLLGIAKALRTLPHPIQSICNVQFFGWMGIFPFLFYSTSWVALQVKGVSGSGDSSEGTRAGSFAMLIYSIVSVVTGFVLPLITVRGAHEARGSGDVETGLRRLRSSTLVTSVLRGMHSILGLPAIWAFSFWLFTFLMFATIFVHSIPVATALIATVGVSWGIMQWVPFTLLGECVNHYGENPGEHINAASPLSDGQGYTNVPIDDEHEESDGASTAPSTLVNPNATNQRGVAPPAHAHLDAGMVLGIHNIYIVLPQFFATFMCSVTFTLFGFLERRAPAGTSDTGPSVPDGANAPPPPTEAWQDPYDATGWVLRLGAISCIVAGVLALRVQEVHSPTKKKGRVIIAAGH